MLSVEQGLKLSQMAAVGREREATGLPRLKRSLA